MRLSNILESIIIGISILVGSLLINNGPKENANINSLASKVQEQGDKVLLTEDEAIQYLNIPKEAFQKMVAQQTKDKKSLSSYDTYRFIPFITIEGKRYYSKDQINKWVEYNMLNK